MFIDPFSISPTIAAYPSISAIIGTSSVTILIIRAIVTSNDCQPSERYDPTADIAMVNIAKIMVMIIIHKFLTLSMISFFAITDMGFLKSFSIIPVII